MTSQSYVLLLFLVLAWVLFVPVIALVVASRARSEVRELNRQLAAWRRNQRRESAKPAAATPPPLRKAEAADVESGMAPMPFSDAGLEAAPEPPLARTAMPVAVGKEKETVVEKVRPAVLEPIAGPVPPRRGEREGEFPPRPARVNLEHFLGVRLFAWLGGLALFFGVVFFVKYAFENRLLSPAMQIALGYAAGLAAVAGGLFLHRGGRQPSLAHSLCGAGIVALYGVTYAAHALERYQFFGQSTAFGLMSLLTVAAFFIAVRMRAQVAAWLGLAGGFLTPALLSTGNDELVVLTGYVLLLCGGLVAVSRYHGWRLLSVPAALGALLLGVGWMVGHFHQGGYGNGPAVLRPMASLLLLQGVFLAGAWLERRSGGASRHPERAALVMLAAGWVFGFTLLSYPKVAAEMVFPFGWMALQAAGMMALPARGTKRTGLLVAVNVVLYAFLGRWIGAYLQEGNLPAALAWFFGFGVLTAVVPLLWRRVFGFGGLAPAGRKVLSFGALGPLLLLAPCLFRLPDPSLWLWALALASNVLAVALALRLRTVWPVAAGLGATLGLAVLWLAWAPSPNGLLTPFPAVALGMAALFSAAGLALARRMDGDAAAAERRMVVLLPALAGGMSFGVLMLAIAHAGRPPLEPVFYTGLGLALLMLAVARFVRSGAAALCAVLGLFLTHLLWYSAVRTIPDPGLTLAWFAGSYLLFLIHPFLFSKVFSADSWAWISSALAGPLWFLLVHPLVRESYPEVMSGMMGLTPAAFIAPSLAGLWLASRRPAASDALRLSRLAWYGAVGLLFITLVFPIQFERQWITIGWALEGTALLWLFRRVPHRGLRLAGFGLLTAGFVRLALNPAVWLEYPRAAMPVLNWHGYAFGLVALALALGGRWAGDARLWAAGFRLRPALYAMCGVLLFILLNIEIADFFTPPGQAVISLGGPGNFARDMSYSIGWGLYALGLLSLGIVRNLRAARLAAIGLLVVTLLKLFLVDLAALRNVYRIGALVGVALIALAASFLYQRFFHRNAADGTGLSEESGA